MVEGEGKQVVRQRLVADLAALPRQHHRAWPLVLVDEIGGRFPSRRSRPPLRPPRRGGRVGGDRAGRRGNRRRSAAGRRISGPGRTGQGRACALRRACRRSADSGPAHSGPCRRPGRRRRGRPTFRQGTRCSRRRGTALPLDVDLQRPAEDVVAVAADEVEGPLLVRPPQGRRRPDGQAGVPARFQVVKLRQPPEEAVFRADPGAEVQHVPRCRKSYTRLLSRARYCASGSSSWSERYFWKAGSVQTLAPAADE